MTRHNSKYISSFTQSNGRSANYIRLTSLEEQGMAKISRLPYSIRVLLESAMRNLDGHLVTEKDVSEIANWSAQGVRNEIPFIPGRVILQDFTGVPAVVDIAACRDAMHALGGDPSSINPYVDVDLVVDHSVQVDTDGRNPHALSLNLAIEYQRNAERYEFLKWGQENLSHFRVVPPGRGIVHQVNLEWLASVAASRGEGDACIFYPDSLVGTDSHTTMINGLGVLGWGVGGIEAEAVMLGQPIYMLMPDVVGFELSGRLSPGVTATDLTLQVVQMLRRANVVGKFVEFCGPGLSALSLADRATIANMAPEYGATCGFFPVDAQTLAYLKLSGRSASHVADVKNYYEHAGLFREDSKPVPEFSSMLRLTLDEVQPALAGPKRPEDRVELSKMKSHFQQSLTAPRGHQGHGVASESVAVQSPVKGESYQLTHGDVVIAAITSCTNTSNPAVMIAAGLLARNAVERGLNTKPWVKPSLAPGSRVVTQYFEKANLLEPLAKLGFNVVGYGCTTCIGNSGPLEAEIEAAINAKELVVASVLSGNRNFEGRIHNAVKASYLASPPLVVAYALAGTIDIDLANDSIGSDSAGNPVTLADIWPSDEEVRAVIERCIDPQMFLDKYADITTEERWDKIPVKRSEIYPWSERSTYIQKPPFFVGMRSELSPPKPISGARVLLKLGDSVTTDHISPAGNIPKDGPAGRFLEAHGVQESDFNSFGSRRGNHEVMMRGTFANVRIRNQIAPGTEGGWTTYLPDGKVMSVFDAAMKYIADETPLIVLAGEQYGSGSSRDWAAKGTALLGVRAVIAQSFERIHRSNLVGMGVLPLCFLDGENANSLGLTGQEVFDIPMPTRWVPGQRVSIRAQTNEGQETTFEAVVRLDTPVEVEYYENGGILPTVLRNRARASN